MKTYNIHEAKTNLSKILNEVKEGEVVYIAKAGKKVVELKPVKPEKKPIPWGKFKDKIWLADDWDSEDINAEIAKGINLEDLTS